MHLIRVCIPNSLHGTQHIVGPQKCRLSRECGHKHQEHCESAGSQDMLELRGYPAPGEQVSDFSEDEMEAREGKGHLQGHGTLS